MINKNYNLQFDKLFEAIGLGHLEKEPVGISGGLMHRMYAVETAMGKYAVKALNPSVMFRPEALENYINSEVIANIMSRFIPALPAKIIDGNALQKIDGQFYLVFDWVDGNTLKDELIFTSQCRAIGSILAEMHKTDFSETSLKNDFSESDDPIDWDFYLQRGKEVNAVWTDVLKEVMDQLYSWCEKVNYASKLLDFNAVISHGDLEPKNVLWHGNKPIIIDWESAGFINPMFDLLETALYWSRDLNGQLDEGRFLAFLDGYREKSSFMEVDWNLVLDKGFQGKLWWLQYSLKRSLWMDCSDTMEQQMGTRHVAGTISELKSYENMLPTLLKLFKNNACI